MKKGFTLMELLLVLAILSVVGVASILLFSEENDEIEMEELRNKYKEIQKAAILYVDLNNSWLSSFTTNGEIYVRLGELQNENYVSKKIINPVNNTEFSSNYMVKIYKTSLIENDKNAYVNSCIVEMNAGQTKCISNSDGYACGCCDYPVSALNLSCN